MDFTGDEQLQYKLAEAKEAEALLLGVTYEGFAAAWPPRTGPFADKLNSMPKYGLVDAGRAPRSGATRR